MNDSQSILNNDILLTRNKLYLCGKTTLLINGAGGATAPEHGPNPGFKEDTRTEVVHSSMTEKSRIRKAEKKVKVFPPLLSSLNRNGRRRFSLEMVREEGRLQILAVPNHFSEVIRTLHGGDRVSMELLDTGAH